MFVLFETNPNLRRGGVVNCFFLEAIVTEWVAFGCSPVKWMSAVLSRVSPDTAVVPLMTVTSYGDTEEQPSSSFFSAWKYKSLDVCWQDRGNFFAFVVELREWKYIFWDYFIRYDE